MSSPVPIPQPRWRRVAWGIAGIPVTLVLFALLLVIMFPIGGGIFHLMFAYFEGGSLSGARRVFAGFVLATVFITGFLRWTRYPLPWRGRASVAGAIAFLVWLAAAPLAPLAGPAFRAQGLLLAPVLPVVAFAVGAWSERRRPKRRREGGNPMRPRSPILILLIALLPGVLSAGESPSGPPANDWSRRLAAIDELVRAGDWRRAEEASRQEVDRSRQGLSASVMAAAVARLALVEAGLGREQEAVWHWQVAQSLDRNILPGDLLRTFGAPGELLSRHPLRPAGQAPAGLEVHSPGGPVEPPRKAEGALPELSVALRALSVPLWLRAQVVVDTEGRPRDPVVLATSLPGMAFEVLETVRGWRFEPARKEGRPVASFYQLTLNPVVEKPLAEITQSGHPGLAELDSLLRAGRWKEANRKARKLWLAGLSNSLEWKQMGLFLSLRALAEAGAGSRDEAICHWQAAQHLDPGLYHADLAAYGPAGDLLEAHRWGIVLADVDPAGQRIPPEPVKAPAAMLPVRTPIRGRFLMAGIIDSGGRVRQPVLWASQKQETLSHQIVWQDIVAVREVPVMRSAAITALESVCSWQFEPARIGNEPRMAASMWTVSVNVDRAPLSSGPIGVRPEHGPPSGPRGTPGPPPPW